MKINFILPGIDLNGGVRAVFKIANRLEERSHDVHIIYPFYTPALEAKWSDIQTRLYRLGKGCIRTSQWIINTPPNWFDLKAELVLVPSTSPSLIPLFEHLIPDADVVIATGWTEAYATAALSNWDKYYFIQHYEIWPVWENEQCWESASMLSGDPSVAMTDVTPEDNQARRHKCLVDKSYELGLKHIITSDWEKRVIERLGQGTVGKVPLGIDTEKFYPSAESEDFTLLALYRDSLLKGDREAIQSMKALHKIYSDIRYIMFGKSKTGEIPDFVEFHKNPSEDQLRSLYSISDVLIYPSWVEGYGLPPMEAMACKTALISADVGAVSEYTPSEGVRYIDRWDTNQIISTVKDLYNDRETLDRMKSRNLQYIQSYTWDRTAAKFERILS